METLKSVGLIVGQIVACQSAKVGRTETLKSVKVPVMYVFKVKAPVCQSKLC